MDEDTVIIMINVAVDMYDILDEMFEHFAEAIEHELWAIGIVKLCLTGK